MTSRMHWTQMGSQKASHLHTGIEKGAAKQQEEDDVMELLHESLFHRNSFQPL